MWDPEVLACLSFRPKAVIEIKNNMSGFTKGPGARKLVLTALCSSLKRQIFPPIICQEMTQKQWEQQLGV